MYCLAASPKAIWPKHYRSQPLKLRITLNLFSFMPFISGTFVTAAESWLIHLRVQWFWYLLCPSRNWFRLTNTPSCMIQGSQFPIPIDKQYLWLLTSPPKSFSTTSCSSWANNRSSNRIEILYIAASSGFVFFGRGAMHHGLWLILMVKCSKGCRKNKMWSMWV